MVKAVLNCHGPCRIREIAGILSKYYYNPLRVKVKRPTNLVPRVSHLTAWGERGETLVGSGHVLLSQLRTSGRVLCNQAVCRIELCRAATAIQPAMFNSSLRAKTSKSIYSDVYLKVRQLCLETIYRGLDVVAVVPFGFMESRSYFNCARRAAQFYSEVIIINCCFSFECARSD